MATNTGRTGRDAIGNITVAGNGNRIDSKIHIAPARARLPQAEDVDIARELEQIRAILSALRGDQAGRIGRAMEDAAEEARKPEPDKEEVGKALGRALDYAKKTGDLTEQAQRLAPHLSRAVGWLGQNWHKLLPFVGLIA